MTIGALSAVPVMAETYGLETLPGGPTAIPTLSTRLVIANVIRGLMGLLAVLIVSRVIAAIFMIMTHGGNSDLKHKAYATLEHSLIGLVVVVASSSAVTYLVNTLFDRSGLANYL